MRLIVPLHADPYCSRFIPNTAFQADGDFAHDVIGDNSIICSMVINDVSERAISQLLTSVQSINLQNFPPNLYVY
ncbi:hypothetical protein DAI22_06g148200 [Oryza sativa Japonica Group]|nr:hypothetical protein DAI22_06g148200 [Oryza sativa Japonica Group]